jgi:hypothetical protein
VHTAFRATILLLSISATAFPDPAHPNGVEPPRTNEVTPTIAVCADRSGGGQHKILRAQVSVGDESVGAVTVLIDKEREEVPIDGLRALTLTTAKIDRSGFTDVILVREDGSEERGVKLLVKSKKRNVNLTGFNDRGENVAVSLSKCKNVHFSSLAKGDGNSNRKPVMGR